MKKIAVFCFLVLVGFGAMCQSRTHSKSSVKRTTGAPPSSGRILPNELIEAGAASMIGKYDYAIELYQTYISSSTDVGFVHYANGGLGYCLAKTKRYEEALPALTKYINYYTSTNRVSARYAGNVGRSFVYRGFSKGMLDDHRGAIADLSKGIQWLEYRLQKEEFKTSDNYEILGLGFLIRGAQKSMVPGSSATDGCSDFRRAADLGQNKATDYIAEFCN